MKKKTAIKVYKKDDEIEKVVVEEKYYCKNVLIKKVKKYYYKEINLNEAERIIESNSKKHRY